MWNRHRESKNSKLCEIGSGTKLFITFELKVIRHEKREHNLSMLTAFTPHLSTQPTRGARSAQSSSGLTQHWMWTFSFRGRNSTNCFFSNLSPRSRCVTSPTSLVRIPIWDFYFDISEWHIPSASAWTPALMLHLTNQCTEPKGSHPN